MARRRTIRHLKHRRPPRCLRERPGTLGSPSPPGPLGRTGFTGAPGHPEERGDRGFEAERLPRPIICYPYGYDPNAPELSTKRCGPH